MQRVATFSRIVGNGNVEVIMNGMVNEEIKRQQEELTREKEWSNMIAEQRNELLKEKYKPKHKSIWYHTREIIYYILACALCICEDLKLIEYIGDKKVR